MKPLFEIADVLRQHAGEYWTKHPVHYHHARTLKALVECRTAALGGHADACDECGYVRISYNSCRNRHCPKCQNTQRERWIMNREADLLPVEYFHVVFTLPDTLNELCLKHPASLYDLLFRTAWTVIRDFGFNPKFLGAETGMTAVLHTWGQNLSLHPHLHCIVPSGGLDYRDQWRNGKGKGKFLFPVKAMSKVFRARFVEGLRKWSAQSKTQVTEEVYRTFFSKNWMVYAKRPFGGPNQVVEYLGRYSHKVAISNHRLINVNEDGVLFSYKDYRKDGVKKQMQLKGDEFIRRFCLHILPPGFVRIRHYGILGNRMKKIRLDTARESLGTKAPEKVEYNWRQIAKERMNFDPDLCPCCGEGKMQLLVDLTSGRAPPLNPMPSTCGPDITE